MPHRGLQRTPALVLNTCTDQLRAAPPRHTLPWPHCNALTSCCRSAHTGTDPSEGAALGTALLRKLVAGGVGAGALTIATTHHSVMTGLKFEDPRFENACVEFDEVRGREGLKG
jgi:hypothetical protein